MTSLKSLRLFNNFFVGTIASGIGNLKELSEFSESLVFRLSAL